MRGKKTQKKKYKVRKKQNNNYVHEIQGILVMALGVLVMLSFYIKGSIGVFGTFMREVSLGLLGMPAFLIPPVIILCAAILIFAHDKLDIKGKPIYIIFLFLLVSAMIQTGYYKPEDYNGLDPMRALGLFYNNGLALTGGGVLGGLISLPFLLTFRVLGTIIIITALSLVDVILLTNSSISQFLKNIRSLFSENTGKATKKAEKTEVYDDDDTQPSIVQEGDKMSLRFDKKPKVIDFKIEKTVRELKEKETGNKKKQPDDMEQAGLESAAADESLSLVIGDLMKKSKPKARAEKQTPAMDEYNSDENEPTVMSPAEKTAVENTTGLTEIIIKGASPQKSPMMKYVYPPYELLVEDADQGGNSKNYRNQVLEGAKKLEETLNSFGVSAKVINVTRGPSVTRYELQPSAGVKVSRIVNLSDDIALNLAAPGIRLEAPIPGKAAIGIEVPNKEVNMVRVRDVIESQEFSQQQSKLAFAVGKDVSGEIIIIDIAKMPHLLIAGATGSGKSVCINSLIVSLLYKASPEEVKLLMIDPKVVELGVYNGIPHLLIPVVTEPKKAAGALNWAVQEMVNRYKLFADKGVRDIKGYNELMARTGESPMMPQIVIIIDELADLMMVAPNDVEDAICRLAQMARAAGMHLVIATQRPSVDVITGVIKANIPSRISFAVSSQIDSRTILDMAGAEKLLGRGDMLLHPVGKAKPVRVQGANITDAEVEKVVEFVKSQGSAAYDEDIIEGINSEDSSVNNDSGDNDELLPRAIDLVVEAGQASVSLIQRKFKVGYARAARIVDQMEARGIVGGFEGSKPRQILISRQQWQEMQMNVKGD
ncbi:MAG TPA: DNA translocase FtsK 4TM domain-containing protein [Clostridia bacterium]|nr:DNA translocase FtsK 4TM domain-containing protein [Clostridia bacterium]